MSHLLPNIFPEVGPVTRLVLLSDFTTELKPANGLDWHAEVSILIEQGLAGVALRAIREQSLRVDADVLECLQRTQFLNMTSTAHVVRRSMAGLECLEAASIPFVLTKGAGIAQHCAAMSDRPFVDIDVLVPPSLFRRALGSLRNDGLVERLQTQEPWDVFNRFCREAINLRSEAGGSIDLHHRVSPWCWSEGLTHEHLLSRAQSIDVFGVHLPVVSAQDNLMVVALHVVSDKSHPGHTYRAWRDLLVLVNACSVESVVHCAQETGLAAWLEWIIGCLPEEVRPTELLTALSNTGPRMHNAFRLRMLLPPRLAAEHPMLGRTIRVPVPQAALFVAGTLVPSASYLRNRYPDEKHRYLKWWRESPQNFRDEPVLKAAT